MDTLQIYQLPIDNICNYLNPQKTEKVVSSHTNLSCMFSINLLPIIVLFDNYFSENSNEELLHNDLLDDKVYLASEKCCWYK